MKKAISIIFLIFAVLGSFCCPVNVVPTGLSRLQTPAVTPFGCVRDTVPAQASPELTLQESEYNFGKIPQGKPVTHVFVFKNTGNLPLSLERVQASCGCTTPEWNKDTIPPGGTSKITVGYNAQNEGPFAKPVTITYGNNEIKQIIIKGEVWKTPVTSAPLNTTVESLSNEQ
ncbi:MAG: DUF1573 domain-containing protein [Bacteroidota bacterium]|nr:DUF1573 domain-containing protein [Bacteroidota bacterium]